MAQTSHSGATNRVAIWGRIFAILVCDKQACPPDVVVEQDVVEGVLIADLLAMLLCLLHPRFHQVYHQRDGPEPHKTCARRRAPHLSLLHCDHQMRKCANISAADQSNNIGIADFQKINLHFQKHISFYK
jgi:hypothetical protein